MSKLLVMAALCLLVTACAVAPRQPAPPRQTEPERQPTTQAPETPPDATAYSLQRVGTLTDKRATEVSGLALSTLHNQRFWMINDSGNSPVLMAFSRKGEFQASVATRSSNRDWEALSSFELNGNAYLLVADTGDNLRAHAQYRLLIFAEPELSNPAGRGVAGVQDPDKAQVVEPLATLSFVYPDGRHDCEAVAVSVAENKIYLITKGNSARGIYSLPLQLKSNNQVLTASHLGNLSVFQQSLADQLLGNLVGVDLSQATALDFNDENSAAFLLTYRGIYRWTKDPSQQSWGDTMTEMPERLSRHSLAQAEAMTWSKDKGGVYVVSERIPSPILLLSPGTR